MYGALYGGGNNSRVREKCQIIQIYNCAENLVGSSLTRAVTEFMRNKRFSFSLILFSSQFYSFTNNWQISVTKTDSICFMMRITANTGIFYQ